MIRESHTASNQNLKIEGNRYSITPSWIRSDLAYFDELRHYYEAGYERALFDALAYTRQVKYQDGYFLMPEWLFEGLRKVARNLENHPTVFQSGPRGNSKSNYERNQQMLMRFFAVARAIQMGKTGPAKIQTANKFLEPHGERANRKPLENDYRNVLVAYRDDPHPVQFYPSIRSRAFAKEIDFDITKPLEHASNSTTK